MSSLDAIRDRISEPLRDIKLNLQAVLAPGGSLGANQKWGVAIASAAASNHPVLRDALIELARQEVEESVIEDALAAAALMAMNNVYYRFRHLIGKASYSEKPARLRMNRIARPATNKADFELYCLAVSAINGCETCIRAHEAVVIPSHSEDHVHDAVRIAAVVRGAAVALELSSVPPPAARVEASAQPG